MTKPIKHCPFCLGKGLFACFTIKALNTFFRLAVLYHVFRHYPLIIFTCLIQTKCPNFYYLHLAFPLFLLLAFPYSTNHSQEKDCQHSGGIPPLFLRASQSNFSYSLPRAIGAGLSSAMIFGLTTLLSISLRPPARKIPTPKRKRTSRLLDGISIGAWAGLGFGIVTTLEEGPSSAALLYTAIVSIGSVFFGIVGGESLIRIGEIRTAETVAWSWQNIQRHMGGDIAKGATIGLSIAILIFCILSAASGLFYGPDYAISYGIIYGIITGLIVGVISLLTTILNRGWDSSILSQDQLAQPNEGIRRSLRHSLFAGLLFGPIGGLASGLVAGLAFGLIGRLPEWPILAVGFSIVFTLILTLQFALIRGGTACIEHAILRWFLWRKRCIPLDYTNFLEFAAERILLRRVGGGYIFTHRLLLEYFSTLEEAPKEDQRTRT